MPRTARKNQITIDFKLHRLCSIVRQKSVYCTLYSTYSKFSLSALLISLSADREHWGALDS